ncbi:MAG: transposase [Sedimenticola sp.]
MSNYQRANAKGATYFFTVVTKERKPWFGNEENVNILREAFRITMNEKPFEIEAAVILTDHLHCIWKLPEGDNDYSGRWREIKKRASRHLDKRTNERGERPVWQRRFWEHRIRDDQDWRNHIDYIHYNPVKHQLVERVSDWPWSSFHQAVAKGWYEQNWGNTIPHNIADMNHE